MQIHYNLPQTQNTAITIGSFDGLHLGHRYLLNQLMEIADKNDLPTFVLSFEPHPRLVLPHNESFRLLTTLDEKIELLKKIGIDNLVLIPFDQSLSQMTAEEFITHYILNPLQPQAIVLGYDHKFGKDRKGSMETFLSIQQNKKAFFELYNIDEWKSNELKISSTTIRNLLVQGDVSQANQLLGYKYSLSGTVVLGKQLGRTIGFPTANIQLNNEKKLIPKNGIYAAKIEVDGKLYKAATNIGSNPTTDSDNQIKIESYILHFEEDIYGKNVRLFFVNRLRDEEKFDSIDALKRAIANDVQRVEANL